jgi:hypothetical protein
MADIPLTVAIPVATTLVGAVATLFGLFVRAKNNESKAWKTAYKGAVASRRRIRRDVEELELGAPSVPPPPDDSEYDDDTKRIAAIDREDCDWKPPRPLRIERGLPGDVPLEAFEDRLTAEQRRKNELDRKLRKFTEQDGESTPPEPPFRRKLPSRRG